MSAFEGKADICPSCSRAVRRGGSRSISRNCRSCSKSPKTRIMSQLGLQIIIVVAFGALCFGVGYLTATIVRRNRWRDEMIKRGFARYNGYTGKWEWGEPPKESSS
jgi:hypothetical protein